MKKLEALINELESYIPQYQLTNQQVSNGSVGWHIEHTLLTCNLIIEALKKSDPKDYKWSFNLKRTFVFTINKIPRGKAKAPQVVQPKNDFNSDTLRNHIAIANEKLKILDTLKSNHYFDHPYFGKVNLSPAIRFLAIHTNHHLHIIKDIVSAEGK